VDAAVPGVSALAAPVFDASGTLVLSLTAIGPTAVLDAAADGAVAVHLRQAAAALSALLGWRGPAASASPARAARAQ
jgi:DNA-binding IclR family transcriptional regulator